MRVLMTGGSGFIGRAILPFLDKHEVHLLCRSEFDTPYASTHICDFFDTTLLFRKVYELQADCLLHVAWDTTPGVYAESTANFDWLSQSLKLFDFFARAGGKKIVGAGSCLEHGLTKGRCFEQTTELRPQSLYGAAKASLYMMGEKFAKQKGLSFAWGRIFYPYGPWEKRERLIPQLIASIGSTFEIANFNQKKDFIHVEDVGRAFAALVEHDIQGAVNIGSGQSISLGKLGRMITDVPNKEGDDSEIVADICRLATIAKPQISLEEGIKSTIAWHKDAAYYSRLR